MVVYTNKYRKNLISSLQESLKFSQDNEVNLLNNEKFLLDKIHEKQLRERNLERNLSHYKNRPSVLDKGHI